MTTEELKRLDDELNGMIRRGEILAAMDRFYAPGAEMQENLEPPTRGKEANVERERSFWSGITLHEAQLLAQGIGDGVTLSEWRFDWTIGGKRGQLHEVAVRHWRDGRIVAERFHYK